MQNFGTRHPYVTPVIRGPGPIQDSRGVKRNLAPAGGGEGGGGGGGPAPTKKGKKTSTGAGTSKSAAAAVLPGDGWTKEAGDTLVRLVEDAAWRQTQTGKRKLKWSRVSENLGKDKKECRRKYTRLTGKEAPESD